MTIVNIQFTGLGLSNGYRGDEWFENRINIYNNYTFKSLVNQTDKDFYIWLCFREEERNNPLINKINKTEQTFLTFGGITIWDDKKQDEEKGLLERIKKTIPELKFIKEDVRLINLGSDDMYSIDTIERVNKEEFVPNRVLTHRNGYVYNISSDRLAEWLPTTNPPFYCVMLKNEDLTNADRYYAWASRVKSHEFLPQVFDEKRMEDFKYMVVTHDYNISTIFNHPFKGNEFYYDQDKLKIKKQFGI